MFEVDDHVYDLGKPVVSGIIRKVFKRTVHVEFISGVAIPYKAIYDKAHQKEFLRKMPTTDWRFDYGWWWREPT